MSSTKDTNQHEDSNNYRSTSRNQNQKIGEVRTRVLHGNYSTFALKAVVMSKPGITMSGRNTPKTEDVHGVKKLKYPMHTRSCTHAHAHIYTSFGQLAQCKD